MSFFRSKTTLNMARKTTRTLLGSLISRHHSSLKPSFFNSARLFPSSASRLIHADNFPVKISTLNANGIKPKIRSLATLLQEIAKDLGLEFKLLGNDWIIMLRDPITGKKEYMLGNIMGFNNHAASALCSDKAALSTILTAEGISHIPHRLFLSPAQTDWLHDTGTFLSLRKYTQEYNYNVVIKPTDGYSGNNIFHCKDWRHIEKTALLLFKDNRSLVVSPFEKIIYELRIVFLDGSSLLVFKKIRPTVYGDGVKTIKALFIEYFLTNQMEIDKFFKKFNAASDLDLARVPAKGESVPIGWKHNISAGATASLEIEENEKSIVSALAIKAAKAVGAQFVTVDVARIDNNGKPHYKIIEINSTVTITDTLPAGKKEQEIVKSVYKAAFEKLFASSPAAKENLDHALENHPRLSRR